MSILASLKRSNQGEIRIFEGHDAYSRPFMWFNSSAALLRSESLKDVTLPAGITGWRILDATTVDDSTPATAVADGVCANSSARRTPARDHMGARHDRRAAKVYAVARVGANCGHSRAGSGRRSGLGNRRDGLLIRREGRAASLPHRRRRSARSA
jgi:hypothetical protein